MRNRVPRFVPLAALALMLASGCAAKHNAPTGGGGGGGGTGKELDSGNIAPGGTYSHTFSTAGDFAYHCTIHGLAMSGSVVVQ